MSFTYLHEIPTKALLSYDVLLKEIWTYFVEYSNSYGGNDFRCSLFSTYITTVLWAIAQLEIFINRTPDLIINKRFNTLKASTLTQILLQYDTINRKTYVVDIMFSTEHFINALCQALLKKQFPTYKHSIDAIVTDLFGGNQDKINELYALYLIRNSIHNNGYINRKITEFDLTIENTLFQFRNNSQITFSGWDNLYLFSKRLIETIIDIIEAQKVANIPLIPHNNMLEFDTGVLLNNTVRQSEP